MFSSTPSVSWFESPCFASLNLVLSSFCRTCNESKGGFLLSLPSPPFSFMSLLSCTSIVRVACLAFCLHFSLYHHHHQKRKEKCVHERRGKGEIKKKRAPCKIPSRLKESQAVSALSCHPHKTPVMIIMSSMCLCCRLLVVMKSWTKSKKDRER